MSLSSSLYATPRGSPFDWYIGIDPGKTGCISLLSADWRAKPKYWPMPKTPKDVWELFEGLRATTGGDAFIMLEKVWGRKGDSAVTAFTFGRWAAYVEMAIIGNRMGPLETVTPQKWQGALGCLTKGDKEVARAKAQELFPDLKIGNKNHADGLLIGYYGRQKFSKEEN